MRHATLGGHGDKPHREAARGRAAAKQDDGGTACARGRSCHSRCKRHSRRATTQQPSARTEGHRLLLFPQTVIKQETHKRMGKNGSSCWEAIKKRKRPGSKRAALARRALPSQTPPCRGRREGLALAGPQAAPFSFPGEAANKAVSNHFDVYQALVQTSLLAQFPQDKRRRQRSLPAPAPSSGTGDDAEQSSKAASSPPPWLRLPSVH